MRSYIDYLKYREMFDSRDHYFKNKKVTNFDLINHECPGDPLKKALKEHNSFFQRFCSVPRK